MEEKIWFVAGEFREPLTFLSNNGEKAVYLFLHLRGGATRKQVTDGLEIGPSTVERAIKGLAHRGIIEGR